ncbi:hypothetical protein Hanom_Chr15g01342521 [Helianthus anomalus]
MIVPTFKLPTIRRRVKIANWEAFVYKTANIEHKLILIPVNIQDIEPNECYFHLHTVYVPEIIL